jgi:plasmid stability protein
MNKTVAQLAIIKHHRAYPDFPEETFQKLRIRAKRNKNSIRREIVELVGEVVKNEKIAIDAIS